MLQEADLVQRVYCEAQKLYNRQLEDGFAAIVSLSSGIKAVADYYASLRAGQLAGVSIQPI
jgi:hypothetical protein